MQYVARLLSLFTVGALLLGASTSRRPIGPGVFYPIEPKAVYDEAAACLEKATPVPPAGRCVAAIVPHGLMNESGVVAANLIKTLNPEGYDRIIILGAAHYTSLLECSIPSIFSYETPLGSIPMEGHIIRELLFNPLFSLRSVRYDGGPSHELLHEREYSVETVLPLLQVHMKKPFSLVPIVVGTLNNFYGNMDLDSLDSVARSLKSVTNDRTLLLISSNFTHYGNRFSYTPFREDVVSAIAALDNEAFSLILNRRPKGFIEYEERTKNTICGKEAIAVLLRWLPANAKASLLSYQTSTSKEEDAINRSISYASIGFYVED